MRKVETLHTWKMSKFLCWDLLTVDSRAFLEVVEHLVQQQVTFDGGAHPAKAHECAEKVGSLLVISGVPSL